MGIRLSRRQGSGQESEAAALRERLTPVIDRSRQAAEEAAGTARAWAGPRVEAARAWAAPHVERGVSRGREMAAPAGEHLGPVVESTRDRFVEDLIPRIVGAVSAGIAAAAHVRGASSTETPETPVAAAATEPAPAAPPRLRRCGVGSCCGGHRSRGSRPARSRVLLALAVVAGLAAAIMVLLRSRRDPTDTSESSSIWTETDLIPPAAGEMAGTVAEDLSEPTTADRIVAEDASGTTDVAEEPTSPNDSDGSTTH